jgi:hypothetical protein
MHRECTHFPDEPNLREIIYLLLETDGLFWVRKPGKSNSHPKRPLIKNVRQRPALDLTRT